MHGIYCDALVDDDEFLVFASLWGRDTAIQELLARLVMSSSEGGISQLKFISQDNEPNVRNLIRIGNPDRLDKITGRMPKKNIFGDMVHCWLFDTRVRSPDFSNRSAYLLNPHDQLNIDKSKIHDEVREQTWQLIKAVCHIPLLDLWQNSIMNLLFKNGWIETVHGYAIDNISIHLPEEEFEAVISQMIVAGDLSLDEPSDEDIPNQILNGIEYEYQRV
jgi:hypothetical protein